MAITLVAMQALDDIRPMAVGSEVKVFGLSESQVARRVKVIARAAGWADWEFFSGRVSMARRMAQNGAPPTISNARAAGSRAAAWSAATPAAKPPGRRCGICNGQVYPRVPGKRGVARVRGGGNHREDFAGPYECHQSVAMLQELLRSERRWCRRSSWDGRWFRVLVHLPIFVLRGAVACKFFRVHISSRDLSSVFGPVVFFVSVVLMLNGFVERCA